MVAIFKMVFFVGMQVIISVATITVGVGRVGEDAGPDIQHTVEFGSKSKLLLLSKKQCLKTLLRGGIG